jgi:Na+-transporting methylmalonyl-CoA/oxaloacetate decarboxylase gamma subunit
VTTLLATTSADNAAAPGVLGFIVVFGLAVILVFMFRSMSNHIRKVNNEARREEDARAAATSSTPDAPQPAATSADRPGRPRT